MTGLNQPAKDFLDLYERRYEEYQTAAILARNIIQEIGKNVGPLVHVITARAKTLDSMRDKLRRKNYTRPDLELTDVIGVRIITCYRDDVDPVVTLLRKSLEIRIKGTEDKRVRLALREFGYRSVHLMARLKRNKDRTIQHKILRGRWFEIQVRSILEHAWAEIEHEVVYKSGIKYPPEITRQFASLAGTLELLDNEFLALRDQRDGLIDSYYENYAKNRDQWKSFDVARLQGFLEAVRPKGLSWRKAAKDGVPFNPGLDASCVDALKAARLLTPRTLRKLFKSPRFRNALSSFAASQGIAPASVSHLAVIVLAIVVKDARMVGRYFPEIVFDPAIERLVGERSNL